MTLATADERYAPNDFDNKDRRFLISSEDLENDIAYFRKHNIEKIVVGRQQWRNSNLDGLKEIANEVIEMSVMARPRKPFSFEALSNFSNLEKLNIYNYQNHRVDLSENVSLKSLLLWNCAHVTGIECLTNLENAAFSWAPEKLLTKEVFSKLKNLTGLSLSNTNLEGGLDFLAQNSLSGLWLNFIKKVDLTGITQLGISELRLDKCKQVDSAHLIFDCDSLHTLKLTDTISVSSADEILKLPNLDLLVITGTSVLEDGDFSPLKYKLQHIGYSNKRHYKIKSKEFTAKYLRKQ